MTFLVSAGCQDTGRFGVVVSTHTPAVDRTICVCSPGRGIAVVRALGSAALLVRASKLLDVNNDAAWIVDALSLSDSHPELRQLAAFDSAGRSRRERAKKPLWAGTSSATDM